MEIERFKSKLSKGQLEAMAVDTVKNYMDEISALEILSFAKKLKVFSDTLIKESEAEAKMVWDHEKSDYPNMNYTQGGAIYDYKEDPVYASIALMLEQRTELLKTAVKLKDPVYDSEGIEVPKVKVKGYRKDSINVKI